MIRRSLVNGALIMVIAALLGIGVFPMEGLIQDLLAQRPLHTLASIDRVFVFGYTLIPVILYGLPLLAVSLLHGILLRIDVGRRAGPWLGVLSGALVAGWGYLNYLRGFVRQSDGASAPDLSGNYLSLVFFTIYFILAFAWSSRRLMRLSKPARPPV